jgi:hypothetical protein
MTKELKCVDIMLDLETLGLKDNIVITQIAAVAFTIENGQNLSEFNVSGISTRSCIDYGFKIDGSTIEWWLKQDHKLFNDIVIKSLLSDGPDIKSTLISFTKWINDIKIKYKVKYVNIYGNGILADNKWISQAFDLVNLPIPWNYTDNRDVRTYVDIYKHLFEVCPTYKDPTKIDFIGTKHNALDDCKHQIRYICNIFSTLSRLNKINLDDSKVITSDDSKVITPDDSKVITSDDSKVITPDDSKVITSDDSKVEVLIPASN